MQEFIEKQNKFNQTIDDRIALIEKENVEHGRKINALEKEFITMTGRLEKMVSVLDKVHDKLDIHTETINDIKVQFPTFMNEFVDKNAKRTQEIVSTHEIKCSSEMGKKFISMPEGWKGTATRIGLLLIATVFGLDLSGVFPTLSAESVKPKKVIEHVRLSAEDTSVIKLHDASGNVFYLKQEIASQTQK